MEPNTSTSRSGATGNDSVGVQSDASEHYVSDEDDSSDTSVEVTATSSSATVSYKKAKRAESVRKRVYHRSYKNEWLDIYVTLT